MLLDLGYYNIVYDESPSADDLRILDNGVTPRKVTDNGIPDHDLMLMLQAEQTKHLKSIKYMIIFFVVLTIIGICISVYFGYQIHSFFSKMRDIMDYVY